MSERKVLNKYYPPDFDPSKIPKLRLARNRQYSIRIMAPFNMRCNTCGEYIYKGKKFNSRKETVEDEDYLGLKIFRFYIKCPRCVAEIAFKTDPQNTDYSLEGGATRNFEAMRTAELLAKKEIEEKEQEELNNPMKVLENRTKASQQEMEMIETLEELRDLNSRHAKVDHESLVKLHEAYEEQLKKLQDEEDEKFIKSVFGKAGSDGGESLKRLQDDDGDTISDGTPPLKKINTMNKPTDLLTTSKGPEKAETGDFSKSVSTKAPASWERSVGTLSSSKKTLAGLVRRKQPTPGGDTALPKLADGTHSKPPAEQPDVGQVTPTSVMSQQDTKSEYGTTNKEGGNVRNNGPSQPTGGLGLGLLGAYSDSESDGNSDST